MYYLYGQNQQQVSIARCPGIRGDGLSGPGVRTAMNFLIGALAS